MGCHLMDVGSRTMGRGDALDEGRYRAMMVQSTKVSPTTFRDVDPALFSRIVSQEIPPAAGPGGVIKQSER